MTFKHTKFEDSVTMRSLEKLATEKGLIKNDPLKKIAEKKAKTDLKPTGNLTENIMRLCAGLREAGFAKYAEELESTYIMYKKAATECDNDILQQAHPKGSYKLEGVEGDAVIETIIDQHLANMKMVNKKPTGKLTSANSIISAVKVSLADDPQIDVDDDSKQLRGKDYLSKGYEIIIAGVDALLKVFPSFMSDAPFLSVLATYTAAWNKVKTNAINLKKDSDSEVKIDQFKMNGILHFVHQTRIERDSLAKIDWNMFNVSEDNKRSMFASIAQIDRGISLIWAANQAFRGQSSGATYQEQQVPFDEIISALTPLRSHYQDLLQKVNAIDLNKIKDNYRTAILQWIENIKHETSDVGRAIARLKQSKGSELRLKHPNQVSALFSTELKNKLVAQDLANLRAKISAVITENNDDYNTLTSPGYAK